MMTTNKTVPQLQGELAYWKDQAERWKSGYESVQQQSEEFTTASKQLEEELELDIQEKETKIKELTNSLTTLKDENEALKTRFENLKLEEAHQHEQLASELTSLKTEVEDLRTTVRNLEQRNDDLERANRIASVSIDDFEVKLNLALEKNVLLESELEEKEKLRILVQRLRDEARDLRSEVIVKDANVQDSNRTTGMILTARPSRISPLSIVNDLLKKVGALEAKLAPYQKKQQSPALDDPGKRNIRTEFVKK